jgi:hypothetical protein
MAGRYVALWAGLDGDEWVLVHEPEQPGEPIYFAGTPDAVKRAAAAADEALALAVKPGGEGALIVAVPASYWRPTFAQRGQPEEPPLRLVERPTRMTEGDNAA